MGCIREKEREGTEREREREGENRTWWSRRDDKLKTVSLNPPSLIFFLSSDLSPRAKTARCFSPVRDTHTHTHTGCTHSHTHTHRHTRVCVHAGTQAWTHNSLSYTLTLSLYQSFNNSLPSLYIQQHWAGSEWAHLNLKWFAALIVPHCHYPPLKSIGGELFNWHLDTPLGLHS